MEGIEKIKQLVKVSFDGLNQYKTAMKDGHIIRWEYVGFVDDAVALFKAVSNPKELLAQLKDVDSAEMQELVEYTKSFGVLKENAIIIVANVVAALDKLYDMYVANIIPILEALKK